MVNPDDSVRGPVLLLQRRHYNEQMMDLRAKFDRSLQDPSAGVATVAARANFMDALVGELCEQSGLQELGVAVLAMGGYGRRELFPYSDVDLLFLLDGAVSEASVAGPIGELNQRLWDAGVRAAPMIRTLTECSRFDPENVEFTLALLDVRPLAGASAVAARLVEEALPKLLSLERTRIVRRLLEVMRLRHARYGNTIFHLEPNVKECPGGLRDVHCCAWLARLGEEPGSRAEWPPEFLEAREFLFLVRTFLHLRHGRDDNTLEWASQDGAAAKRLGLPWLGPKLSGSKDSDAIDPSYWMRVYFRHSRAIDRLTAQSVYEATISPDTGSRTAVLASVRRGQTTSGSSAFELRGGRIHLAPLGAALVQPYAEPEHDPQVVFAIFAAIARTGVGLSRQAERRLEDALPRLSANLDDGPALWQRLEEILTGRFAGRAMRALHALGILELILPEFHGIDALVIRDAYHRYTVDEHTFVLLDTLHGLNSSTQSRTEPDVWAERFASLLRDLLHPELLFLAALLHDTGKGHSSVAHALESMRLARNVLSRLDLDPYEAGLVLEIIRNHLEMSAALRRDVFDVETVRSFAARVATPEALRMLTLFTYADITAVHPDALTPWKAESLWRLYMATASFLDRNVDDERLAADAETELGEVMHRVHALVPNRRAELAHFLDGLPRRYLQTRTPDHIRAHFELEQRLGGVEDGPGAETEQYPFDFRYAPGLSELTLVTRDRPMLFASMAGALAAWGMNIVTADAFSNAHGVVVDSFRFSDEFRTLELNDSEHTRFVDSLRDVLCGRVQVESLLSARRRVPVRAPKVQIATRVAFDHTASSHSTLLEVVAQDTPGLLRALSLPIAQCGCNIEVALVDTEGEMAIDVFYITCMSSKLEHELEETLRRALLEAIEANER